ncbi:MAG: SDR family NAD(P)-dependent oxidoreductase [Candidatus Organicella extenuata]|uniref:SDR family NAD(P)-dependent oxidoreductase n=1 Tax=Candidatus Organicella extenuata TaxID=2841811 RepID=A0AA51GGT4_9BACT|nr:MAG: SDR family NAD(P)-dependent oxidoreductase [Candidatus Organicella extenuata]
MGNKVNVIVTGSSRGIGKGIVDCLMSDGGFFLICVSKSICCYENNIVDNFFIGNCVSLCADVSKFKFCKMLSKKILNKYLVGVLVNNAGITKDNLLLRMTQFEWEEVLRVNLSSCFFMIKSFISGMLKSKGGRIINISSVVALMGNAGQSNYCAAKAGIIGLTKSLVKEVSSRNITINCVLPGFIETQMTSTIPVVIRKKILEMIPLKRFGTVKNVSSLVKYCCLRESDYINGHCFTVDGGLSCY